MLQSYAGPMSTETLSQEEQQRQLQHDPQQEQLGLETAAGVHLQDSVSDNNNDFKQSEIIDENNNNNYVSLMRESLPEPTTLATQVSEDYLPLKMPQNMAESHFNASVGPTTYLSDDFDYNAKAKLMTISMPYVPPSTRHFTTPPIPPPTTELQQYLDKEMLARFMPQEIQEVVSDEEEKSSGTPPRQEATTGSFGHASWLGDSQGGRMTFSGIVNNNHMAVFEDNRAFQKMENSPIEEVVETSPLYNSNIKYLPSSDTNSQDYILSASRKVLHSPANPFFMTNSNPMQFSVSGTLNKTSLMGKSQDIQYDKGEDAFVTGYSSNIGKLQESQQILADAGPAGLAYSNSMLADTAEEKLNWVVKHEILVVDNFFQEEQCFDIIQASERSQQYRPHITIPGASLLPVEDANLARILEVRCKKLIPMACEGAVYDRMDINSCLWRFEKPGSHLPYHTDSEMTMEKDPNVRSKLTVILFLNDVVEGGLVFPGKQFKWNFNRHQKSFQIDARAGRLVIYRQDGWPHIDSERHIIPKYMLKTNIYYKYLKPEQINELARTTCNVCERLPVVTWLETCGHPFVMCGCPPFNKFHRHAHHKCNECDVYLEMERKSWWEVMFRRTDKHELANFVSQF
jgi:hypothetical protein